jgi:outer membrane lipoprotein-sorting protein
MRSLWLPLLLVVTATAISQADEGLSAEGVMRKTDERVRRLRDYECFVDTDCRLGSKSEASSFHLWFRNPGMMRAKVLKGRDKGADVVVKDGKIRGRTGGVLKFVTVDLKPTDKRIRNLRGVCITHLQWDNFYGTFRERASRPGAKMSLETRPGAPYEVVLTYPEGARQMREVFRIDPKEWVLLEGVMWEDGVQVSSVHFREFRFDTGAEDKFFKL